MSPLLPELPGMFRTHLRDMTSHASRFFELAPCYVWASVLYFVGCVPISKWKSLITFAYYCFLRPLGKSAGQESRLDRFYEGQANVYDETRSGLLKGRVKMLRLLAAELKSRKTVSTGLIWVDVGGGTGKAIRHLNSPLPNANRMEYQKDARIHPSASI